MAKIETTEYVINRSFAKRGDNGFHIGEVRLEAGIGEMQLNGKTLPANSVEYLLTFALQSLQDAYAGADNEEEAKARFDKKLNAVIEGTIGVRSGGGGLTEMQKVSRQVAREMIRAAYAKAGKAYGDFTSLSAGEQNAKLDAVVDKHREVVEAEAKKRIAAKGKVADIDLGDII